MSVKFVYQNTHLKNKAQKVFNYGNNDNVTWSPFGKSRNA
jgi:hypothetical protein